MKPEKFGPYFWKIIHMISFEYPNNPTRKEKTDHINFILSLQFILPCKQCRHNLSKTLKRMKFKETDMKNKNTFSRFCVDLHNEVNKELGKPIVSYSSVYNMYM